LDSLRGAVALDREGGIHAALITVNVVTGDGRTSIHFLNSRQLLRRGIEIPLFAVSVRNDTECVGIPIKTT
jgi:hypothetical protein